MSEEHEEPPPVRGRLFASVTTTRKGQAPAAGQRTPPLPSVIGGTAGTGGRDNTNNSLIKSWGTFTRRIGRPLRFASRPAVGFWGCRRRAPDPLNLFSRLRRFGCCPTECTCPLRPVQPLLRRGLRCGILRRRSCVADFLTKNARSLPDGWTGLRRAQLRKLRQQPKQRGGGGSWPVT